MSKADTEIELRPEIMFVVERISVDRFIVSTRDQEPKVLDLHVGETMKVNIPIVVS